MDPDYDEEDPEITSVVFASETRTDPEIELEQVSIMRR